MTAMHREGEVFIEFPLSQHPLCPERCSFGKRVLVWCRTDFLPGSTLTAGGGATFCSVLPFPFLHLPEEEELLLSDISKSKTFHFLHQWWDGFKLKIRVNPEIPSSVFFFLSYGAGLGNSPTNSAALCPFFSPNKIDLHDGRVLPRYRFGRGQGSVGKGHA